MTRILPHIAVPEVRQRENPEIVTQIRKYKVITPLYGGGVEPGKVDPITVVRATEIRGHLRFWWRATRGGDPAFEGKWKKMRAREEEIWGSAGETGKPGPSQVIVNVIGANEGKIVEKIEVPDKKKGKISVHISDPKSPWSYAAFPLRETEDKPAGFVRSDVLFELQISYPQAYKNDVQAALWAWETFGGIGARTRRGFGALECIKGSNLPMTTQQNVRQVIEDGLNKHVVSGKWPRGVPHLLNKNQRIKIAGARSQALASWEYLIKTLRSFRQEKARHGGSFGLSQWPETNRIRVLFKKEPKLAEGLTKADLVNKFPRARFGLPIPFHMYHDRDLIPEHLSLEGVKVSEEERFDRLASPLILRPVACAEGAVGMALVLEWEPLETKDEPYTPPGGLVLKGDMKSVSVESNLSETEARKIPPLNGEPDVLQAFLNFLK